MARDHFKQMMFSPYFQSKHYQEESREAIFEKKVINALKKVLFFRNKNY
jgi:hypothetical protein